MYWHFPVLVPHNLIIEGGVEVDADDLQLWFDCPICEEECRVKKERLTEGYDLKKSVFACLILRVLLVGSNMMFLA